MPEMTFEDIIEMASKIAYVKNGGDPGDSEEPLASMMTRLGVRYDSADYKLAAALAAKRHRESPQRPNLTLVK